MRGRAMLGVGHRRVGLAGAHMRSHALSLVEDLDGCRCCANFHRLPRQRIRYAIRARIELTRRFRRNRTYKEMSLQREDGSYSDFPRTVTFPPLRPPDPSAARVYEHL